MLPASDAMPSVFDGFVESYEAACERGLAISGEHRDHFAAIRIARTCSVCVGRTVTSILDFGCGLGHSAPHLLAAFPEACVTGIDTSTHAIDAARRRYGNERTRFAIAHTEGTFDLAYSNGTFHHIEPAARETETRRIYERLVPGGLFALWENNPWNPGTRLVMKCIPFDRGARPLSYRAARLLLERAGFRIIAISFHFYFPSWLKALRCFEPWLERFPLGAQYCVLATRD
jgi:SAM-dependent methyltransferase